MYRLSPVRPVAEALRLFGLAAGRVYLAAGVTSGAVRSYRTISPLPEEILWGFLPAVSFLLHCPSDCSALMLSSTGPAQVDQSTRMQFGLSSPGKTGRDRHFGRDKITIIPPPLK